MKMHIYLVILLMAGCFSHIYAQDSTFVTQYELTGYPWDDYYHNGVDVENVLVRYDGGLSLQTMGISMFDNESIAHYQSPIINFDGNGTLINQVIGPLTSEGYPMNGSYNSIIQDRNGGYIAFETFDKAIHALDGTFNYQNIIRIYTTDGIQIRPLSFYEVNDGYIVIGRDTSSVIQCAKLNYSNQTQWSYTFATAEYPNIGVPKMALTTDHGFLFWKGYNNQLILMKISPTGDSLYSTSIPYPAVNSIAHDLIESNDNYFFAASYIDIENHQFQLQIIRFRLDTSQPDILYSFQIVNDLSDTEINPRFMRLTDGSILLTAALQDSQLIKFDTDMNLIWGCNLLLSQPVPSSSYTCMGRGTNPTRELANGDLVTCAYRDRYWVYLVRANSLGQVTSNEEAAQSPKPTNYISVYPNPFSTTLTIAVERKLPTQTKLKIYNLKGQLVKSLNIDGRKTEWLPGNISSGIYFIELNAAGRALEIHKALLMKGERK